MFVNKCLFKDIYIFKNMYVCIIYHIYCILDSLWLNKVEAEPELAPFAFMYSDFEDQSHIYSFKISMHFAFSSKLLCF